MEKPAEFRGWRRSPSGEIVEIAPDTEGSLFSAALNLHFRWEDQLHSQVRLLRPYLPDGTPITTPMEEQHLRMEEQHLRIEAETRAEAEAQRRRDVEVELEQLRAQLAKHENKNT